jgi:hypothetical protein
MSTFQVKIYNKSIFEAPFQFQFLGSTSLRDLTNEFNQQLPSPIAKYFPSKPLITRKIFSPSKVIRKTDQMHYIAHSLLLTDCSH